MDVDEKVELACKEAGHKKCFICYVASEADEDDEQIDNLDEIAVKGKVIFISEKSDWAAQKVNLTSRK